MWSLLLSALFSVRPRLATPVGSLTDWLAPRARELYRSEVARVFVTKWSISLTWRRPRTRAERRLSTFCFSAHSVLWFDYSLMKGFFVRCVCVCVNPPYTGRGTNMQGDGEDTWGSIQRSSSSGYHLRHFFCIRVVGLVTPLSLHRFSVFLHVTRWTVDFMSGFHSIFQIFMNAVATNIVTNRSSLPPLFWISSRPRPQPFGFTFGCYHVCLFSDLSPRHHFGFNFRTRNQTSVYVGKWRGSSKIAQKWKFNGSTNGLCGVAGISRLTNQQNGMCISPDWTRFRTPTLPGVPIGF